MIIKSSSVGMSSERTYQSYLHTQSLSVEMKSDVAATLELSEDGKSYLTQLQDEMKEREKEQNLFREENRKRSAQQLMKNMREEQLKRMENCEKVTPQEDLEIQLLRQMLKALRNARHGNYRRVEVETNHFSAFNNNSLRLNSSAGNLFSSVSSNTNLSVSSSRSESLTVIDLSSDITNIGSGNGSWWTRVTAKESSYTESEYTSFSTIGTAITADGREINFNVEMAMSRACAGVTSSIMMEDYFVTDPLVINMNSNVASVTDQKFIFDLDADGKTEEISFAGEGSGFLALDKNNDGIINDGNELFGTKSGDGFKDLTTFDADGNGWIDEADSIFEKLKIWTKDENGNDKLIRLKDAGIGAMYLGSTNTQFHLKDALTNETNGIIQKTGVYLKENGEVGTMQHVDLVI